MRVDSVRPLMDGVPIHEAPLRMAIVKIIYTHEKDQSSKFESGC